MTVLVTGVAGFIGFHVAARLLAAGERVIGLDNLNDYYSIRLKQDRLAALKGLEFHQLNIANRDAVHDLINKNSDSLTGIIHLAAQAGVRYSLENPYAYIESNLLGHTVMLEGARLAKNLKHLVYASSSSVYGANTKVPFAVTDEVTQPVSLYAATKRADELISYTYAHLYGLPQTGLRFFTVYGPWGRPDMAAYLFTDAIAKGQPIKLFNFGEMQRDFTYIDDIVDGVLAALARPPSGPAPHRLYNLGNHQPVQLKQFIAVIEKAMGKPAILNPLPMQPGDVPATYADIEATERDLGFSPKTPIEIGLPRFVEWYVKYHQ